MSRGPRAAVPVVVGIGRVYHGHSPSETIAYLDWVSDWEDVQQTQRRALPAGVVSPDIDPRERLRGFLCRIRGRE
jgi:hypothetical protein